MGLFSASSSSTTQNDLDETSAQNVDNRVSDGDDAIFEGNVSLTAGQNIGSVTLTRTDYGAIDTAGAIINQSLSALSKGFETVNNTARSVINSAESNTSRAFDTAGELSDDALNTANNALKVASESTRDEGARTIQTGFILAGLVSVAFIFRKRLGG